MIGWMVSRITVVLLLWVRVSINNRVFVEHLSIGLVFGKALEVSNLVLDLGLHLAQTL